jgi:hypothetical protein
MCRTVAPSPGDRWHPGSQFMVEIRGHFRPCAIGTQYGYETRWQSLSADKRRKKLLFALGRKSFHLGGRPTTGEVPGEGVSDRLIQGPERQPCVPSLVVVHLGMSAPARHGNPQRHAHPRAHTGCQQIVVAHPGKDRLAAGDRVLAGAQEMAEGRGVARRVDDAVEALLRSGDNPGSQVSDVDELRRVLGATRSEDPPPLAIRLGQ